MLLVRVAADMLLHPVFGMARGWPFHNSASASAVLINLDHLTEVWLMHPVLGLGHYLNVALAKTTSMMVTTSLALLLSRSSHRKLAFLKVRSLFS